MEIDLLINQICLWLNLWEYSFRDLFDVRLLVNRLIH